MAKRVLVVDDSASVRQVQRMTLSMAGYEVVDAVDGEDGLRKLAPEIRLVITDINMPKLDGLGFIKAIRATQGHKFTPIIVVSTESQEGLMKQARASGATGWIIKPFDAPQLLAVVKKLVG